MDVAQILSEFGWPTLAVVCLILLVYSQRDKIGDLFVRGARIAEQDRELERRRQINGEAYSRELVDRFIRLQEMEREERRSLTRTAIEQAQSTERFSSEAIEVMKEFVDIARLQADRLDVLHRELVPVLRESKGVMDALWFVLVKTVQRQNGDYADELISKAEVDASLEDTSGRGENQDDTRTP